MYSPPTILNIKINNPSHSGLKTRVFKRQVQFSFISEKVKTINALSYEIVSDNIAETKLYELYLVNVFRIFSLLNKCLIFPLKSLIFGTYKWNFHINSYNTNFIKWSYK